MSLYVNGLNTSPFILGINAGVEGKYRPKTFPDSESVITVIFLFRPMAISETFKSSSQLVGITIYFCFCSHSSCDLLAASHTTG